MVSDTGIIVVSIISLAGMILLFNLNNSTWFKRENFKILKYNTMAENKIKLKKLERELGVTNIKGSPIPDQTGPLDVAGQLLPILKNLSGDQIKAIAKMFLGNDEEYEPEGGPQDLASQLVSYATKNPEIVEGLLKGISSKKDNETIYEG